MMKRYTHQLLVTEMCFKTCHLDEVRQPRLKKYLEHELFMMFGISILYARLHKSAQVDAVLEEMWVNCRAYDEKWANHFRRGTVLRLICLPGKGGQNFAEFVYNIANKIVRFS